MSLRKPTAQLVRSCRVCGCTEDDCSGCIERTGEPCYWVAADLCSACVSTQTEALIIALRYDAAERYPGDFKAQNDWIDRELKTRLGAPP